MDKGICTVSVAAIRAENSHRSEMTSQLLYGETVTILQKEGNFYKIKMSFDGFEGWINVQQILLISAENLAQKKVDLITDNFEYRETSEGKTLLSMGSEIPSTKENFPQILSTATIAETAKQFVNVAYLWSGRSFFGVDCSGFVQLVYKVHGISLPRESPQQAEIGEVLSFIEETKSGDLAFFDNEEGMITHVGMMLNNSEIIHAYGKVRIDSLDSTGIFNKELNKHTHKLRFLRSVF
jgi:cell wall-associated NlpC family hydrolase